MEAFKQLRPLDINLEVPISNEKAAIPFYIFKENALNTFSPEVIEERAKTGSKVERVINVETNTLSNILDQYLPASIKIDFLTIDAEGFDFKVLQSNNWQKYRPDIVLLESELQLLDFMNSDIYHFMQKNGYTIYAKSVKTYFLKNDDLNIFLKNILTDKFNTDA
jgi:FkbM family methyltransferase